MVCISITMSDVTRNIAIASTPAKYTFKLQENDIDIRKGIQKKFKTVGDFLFFFHALFVVGCMYLLCLKLQSGPFDQFGMSFVR